ncbi:SGNH/GDSL hydrolase family protein [Alkalimonas delamerensis]|uniref:SGNH/GDSL hydrolase family protein n=1 Tax=Alkalimonas delamerensis TaxID=265981 RepID=A0ABT9GS46_9GAMM|nr:SGNH/GDSL hydrolase family protein [Alkalimonas delamerensis]MDP4529805.1 SGNH/GDSL hydrolase family protein [Alkalimonas delamerensis]
MTIKIFKQQLTRLQTFFTVLVFTLLATPALSAPMFSDMYIFGDSLSDTGNTRAAVPLGSLGPIAAEAGYGSNGRFSNGDLWHEFMADDLGLSTSHSRGGGNNFAHGGARVNNDTGFSAGLLWQWDNYQSRFGGAVMDPAALYVVWAGGNDMRDLVGSTAPLMTIASIMGNYQAMLTEMILGGASTLLVPNLPDLGSIPEFRAGVNSDSGNEVSTLWNQALQLMLLNLANQYQVDIFMLDVFSIFNAILADPASEGFVNTTDECRSLTGNVFTRREVSCADAHTYVFWDEIHPTSRAHQVLGREATALLASGQTVNFQVPAPATVLLLLAGLVVIRLRRRG